MIRLLRFLIIIVMSAFLGLAAVNFKYFICGPDEEHCASGVMPYTSFQQQGSASLYSSGGGAGGTNMPKR